jgi:hypothetical protein
MSPYFGQNSSIFYVLRKFEAHRFQYNSSPAIDPITFSLYDTTNTGT